MSKLTNKQIHDFRTIVYDFFTQNGRELPWRPPLNKATGEFPGVGEFSKGEGLSAEASAQAGKTPGDEEVAAQTITPYHILVSEVMLQQTQVDRVIPFYTNFTETFPTIDALAQAPLKKVLALWQGLGYNRRAQFLHQTAQKVVNEHGGALPSSPEEMETLPGIGPATARSVAVFAFNKPIAFIETNVRSVFLHHFFPGKDNVPDTTILPLVEQTLDTQNPRRWYSALMDYGSVVKKQHKNPSRRSKHHTVQSAFEGSNRQVRGAILKILLKHTTATPKDLAEYTRISKKRIAIALDGLTEEGLVVQKRKRVSLPS